MGREHVGPLPPLATSTEKRVTDVPFDHWNDNLTTEYQNPDRLFQGGVVFGAYQASIQAILELLGSTASSLPLVLPISISPELMSGAMRAGVQPFLLDVDRDGQMSQRDIQEVLSEIPEAVVVLNTPGGQEPSESLLDLLQGNVTILESDNLPIQPVFKTSFTVHSLGSICEGGAVVFHKHIPQLRKLQLIRSGFMGLGSDLSSPQVDILSKRFPYLQEKKKLQNLKAKEYMQELQSRGKSDMIVFREGENWPYFMVKVKNAARVNAHLESEGIANILGVYPLHLVNDFAKRWKVAQPEYPNAERLFKTWIALPTHSQVDVVKVLDTIQEVDHD